MRDAILRQAISLIKEHGFTRKTLSLAPLKLSNNPTDSPLSETAITALFGRGDDARRTLINAWLDEGLVSMRNGERGEKEDYTSIRSTLRRRLSWNEPILELLPEAFALLTASGSDLFPIMHITPAMSHVGRVAHEACRLSGDTSVGTDWYTTRASLALVYGASELHQLTSPRTAFQFLDTLLESRSHTHQVFSDTAQFGDYVFRSMRSIAKSRGLI
ncbi:hypothetical protein Clacol_002461 [Clathrus columnatus]|uniref:COQ9 C-terminal domain-containing protein n=1 Tax=Clathrus columnatus TaxID=1419009 RepID=A0AAV5A0S6_9AGAM|nr:hypothetical protein Clacol_002461 [Clathrus columnatus]